MIQAFVPRDRLVRFMGDASPRSVGLATIFGAASSSCSFAALSAARALVMKGAHFVAAVAFMFASTNLVVELGILIFLFLGWEYVLAEIVGGIVLIVLSTLLIRATYPRKWLEDAREALEEQEEVSSESFDWRERMRSREGWRLVGHRFVGEWGMVWEEIAIGFTIAGFVAVLVPTEWWETIFLMDLQGQIPDWVIALENAVVAPFVAAMTFIGSMGNIPLATVLASNGVLFAGIMGFIYSDLMVPPLVAVNAKYYGWRVALYIAAVMFVSIVATALTLNAAYAAIGLTPETSRTVEDVVRFEVDYTFWLNLFMAGLAGLLFWLHRKHVSGSEAGEGGDMDGWGPKRIAALASIGVVAVGGLAALFT